MDPNANPGGLWVLIVPLVVAALVILRNARARQLKVERLWIAPSIILLMAGLVLAAQGMPRPVMIFADVAALGVGALLGWWRGRLTHITVDPETHALTSKASPVGMLLILTVFALRYGLRSFGSETASLLHVSVMEVTDALVLLAVGIVCVQRLELALRANRLLTEARAA